MTDHQIENLSIIIHSDDWPNVVLPMVKRGNPKGPECAFLVRNHGSKLYLHNMFALETGLLEPQLVELPTKKFDSFEAIIEDGWEVD